MAKTASNQTKDVENPQTADWEGYRTVEIIGWHQKKVRIVRVIFLIHLRSKKANNSLRIFHPGNVKCEVADLSMGFPLQLDEKGKGTHVLESIYGELFSFDKAKKIFRKNKALTAWDSLYDVHTDQQKPEQKKETEKPAEDGDIVAWSGSIKPLFEHADSKKFEPFSAWELSPFESEREYLVGLHITLSDKSYDEFIRKGNFFVVDGPKRLRDRIKHWYIPNLARQEQETWYKRLADFEEYLTFDESYDVITLGKPLADRVIPDMNGSTLITEGPLVSSPEGLFKRYITRDASFKLCLSYENGLFKDVREIPFTKSEHPIAMAEWSI